MNKARSVLTKLHRTTDAERCKRLGQYFTGVGLGRLLAAFAQAENAKTIVDPMAGTGDLLAACLEISSDPDFLAGIEIDNIAHDECIARLPRAHCVLGNAFQPEIIEQLPAKSWDLVIANPPYVRYQYFSEKNDTTHSQPSAIEIRSDLLQTLNLLPALDIEDKRIFSHLVRSYSGLSDLAVPSWILCAAMVKQGGRLALVVPESWLSRDYATIAHYILLRWFDIEFVVEDEHASWFNDAQVKTMLIIAKRVQRRASALSWTEHSTYCHIAISAEAANQTSPIGRIELPVKNAEKSFVEMAQHWLHNESTYSTNLVHVRAVSLKQAYRNVVATASHQKWFIALGEAVAQPDENVYIPHEIHDWLVLMGLTPSFNSFGSQGVTVGQGLRTGANDFFYANGECCGENIELSFLGSLAGLKAKVPLIITKPVMRRQSELPHGFVVSPANAKSWVLDLRGYTLHEDIETGDLNSQYYKLMPSEMAMIINAAEQVNFGTTAKPKKVWELSAVSPNIRSASRGGGLARNWYMLPDFSHRHLPDVLIARVNSATPKAYLNEGRACLIDANFSTMWCTDKSQWTATALLALMNSTWAQAIIEHSGSVMGGGALKVEATHLRRFPVPAFNQNQMRELSELGKKLAIGEDAQNKIAAVDFLIAQTLGCDETGMEDLKYITRTGQERRARHNRKRRESDDNNVC
ncbi:Modification methylase Eco57IB [Yersinia rohdei]|uniref:site-specific DNA-methyltransferase (adenine-specific) n=1 Tax=Yersinia rohdei TaxID=29485 RepID=A0A0U1HRA6_YERRO|nr:N-6 DNA methylase [Yersinia rohdei]CQI89187.1 Modification methylase Eco57IB [Yersinia rohdei]